MIYFLLNKEIKYPHDNHSVIEAIQSTKSNFISEKSHPYKEYIQVLVYSIRQCPNEIPFNVTGFNKFLWVASHEAKGAVPIV